MSTSIQSLRPNVTREEAEAAFGPHHLKGMWSRARLGRLHSLADIYLPFQLFRVTIHNNGSAQERLFGIDSIRGILDLYAFTAIPEQVLTLQTRNSIPRRMESGELGPLLATKVQRVLFQTGFFKMRKLALSLEPHSIVHVPYWVGLYGKEHDLRLRVMDAVRRQMEGAKVRHLVAEWLAN